MRFLKSFSFIVLLLLGFSSYAANNTQLWVAEDIGAFKLSVQDSVVQAELERSENLSVIETDKSDGTLWTLKRRNLQKYTADGAFVSHNKTPKTPKFAFKHLVTLDGLPWVAAGKKLMQFDSEGKHIQTLRFGRRIQGLTLDDQTKTLWVSLPRKLIAVDAVAGEKVKNIRGNWFNHFGELAFDSEQGQLWVADGSWLQRYDRNGNLLSDEWVSYLDIEHVELDGKGGAWIANYRKAIHIDATGYADKAFKPFRGYWGEGIVDIAFNQASEQLYVASWYRINQHSVDGEIQKTLIPSELLPKESSGHDYSDYPQWMWWFLDLIYGVKDVREITAIELAPVTVASTPEVSIASPQSNAYVNTNKPVITLNISGIALSTAAQNTEVSAGSSVISTSCTVVSQQVQCTPDTALSEGEQSLSVIVKNPGGTDSEAATVTIKVDTVAPELTITLPADNATTNQSPTRVLGQSNEPIKLTLNGKDVLVSANGIFEDTFALTEGNNTLTAIATDLANNTTTVVRNVVLDTQAPAGN